MSAVANLESILDPTDPSERGRTIGAADPADMETGAITPALDRSALELLVRRPRRLILMVESESYSGRPLARILSRWSFDVVTACGMQAAAAAIAGYGRVDLAVVALPGAGPAVAELLAGLRTLSALVGTPLLAVASPEGGTVDFDELRKHGVVGLMAHDMSPEHVAFRVGQILPLGSLEERRHVRVPVDFDVEVDVDGERTLHRAENLSMGGLRLRCKFALEVNAAVGLRFRLPLHPREVIEAEARVIHCQRTPGPDGFYSAGLFFRSIPAWGRTLVEVEIVRLLSGVVRS
jgi:DNA-binding response OmpR family regulator